MNDIVYGFLDESPNLSDTTLFFCVGIIAMNDTTNKALPNIIKKARKRTGKKQIKQISEVKFYNASERIRTYVLRQIAKHDVKLFVTVLDKEHRAVKDSPINYGIAVGATIAQVLTIYPTLNLTPDKKFSDSKQEAESLRIAQQTIATLVPKNINLIINPPADSINEPLLQLADFVAGAMNAKYNNKDDHYMAIIAEKIVKESLVNWTQLKKRIVNP